MGHALGPAALDRGIEIGIQHAIACAKLKLQAGPFPDLQHGHSEPLDQLARGQADERAPRLRHSGNGGWPGLLGPRRACAQEQSGREDQDTHDPTMAARLPAGKLAASRTGG